MHLTYSYVNRGQVTFDLPAFFNYSSGVSKRAVLNYLYKLYKTFFFLNNL